MDETFSTLNDRTRPNSLGFLRYLLAALVVFSHSFTLGRFGAEPLSAWTDGREKLGGFAVTCFFILSGFLIAHSYASLNSLPHFLWHRILRIFPGFLVCLVIVAFGFGTYFYWAHYHTLNGYLTPRTNDGPVQYVVYNAGLIIRRPVIAGTLSTAVFPHINGALWTLAYEFACYLLVGLLGFLGLLTRRRMAGLVVVVTMMTAISLSFLPGMVTYKAWLWRDPYAPRLVLFFLGGVLTNLLSRYVRAHWLIFAVAVTATAASLHYSSWFYAMGPLTLSYVIFWLGLRVRMSWWDKPGDFSYGVYIYGFPIQQLLSLTHVNRFGVAVYFIASLGFATLLAVTSFHFIERPALRLKNLWWKRSVRA